MTADFPDRAASRVAAWAESIEAARRSTPELEHARAASAISPAVSSGSGGARPTAGAHHMTTNKTGNGNGNTASGATKSGGTVFSQATPEGAARTVSQVFGEITWLMSQSPLHKNLFLSDLEWKVMVPVMLQQFRLFYDQEKPVGVIFWALVDDEVAARLSSGDKRLRPQDWKSGDKREVVEIVAPFGGAEEMMADLRKRVFGE